MSIDIVCNGWVSTGGRINIHGVAELIHCRAPPKVIHDLKSFHMFGINFSGKTIVFNLYVILDMTSMHSSNFFVRGVKLSFLFGALIL